MVKKSIKQIEIIEKETIKDLQNSTNAWLYENEDFEIINIDVSSLNNMYQAVILYRATRPTYNKDFYTTVFEIQEKCEKCKSCFYCELNQNKCKAISENRLYKLDATELRNALESKGIFSIKDLK